MKLLERAFDPEFFKRVRTEKSYSPLVDFIRNLYGENGGFPLPPLSDELRGIFARTGSRSEFETPYFRRRRFLTAVALLALIYPDEERYLNETATLLIETCKEFSWALPAHTLGTDRKEETVAIDLFAAETGVQLTEICYLLADRLNERVRFLVAAEVKKRVLDPFLSRSFGWEKEKSNWAAVCAGNVGACFLYLAPDLFSSVKPRVLKALNCFLSSYPDDGACLEGFSYWQYGFGEYVWFADLLFSFTDGKIDLLKGEKTEKIATYAQRSFLCGNATVSFSDGSREEKAEIGLIYYLTKRYPNSVRLLPQSRMKNSIGNLGWHQQSRLLFYFDSALETKETPEEDCFLDGAGQAIVRRKNYSLAVKAGHNGEPHNHNDVGSFILATERGQVVADLGAGIYTRQYFSEKTRYSILCNSSRGHSVPVVNGAFQKAGKEYRGALSHGDNVITLSFADAYGQKNFLSLSRQFELFENSFRLTDRFHPDYESFTERLILLKKPDLFDGYAIVENVKIGYDAKIASPVLSEERHAPHERKGDQNEEIVYLLDFSIVENQTSVSFVFEIL